MFEKGCIVYLKRDIENSYLKYCTMQVTQVIVHKCGYYKVKCKIIKNRRYKMKTLSYSTISPHYERGRYTAETTIEKNELTDTELVIATNFLE